MASQAAHCKTILVLAGAGAHGLYFRIFCSWIN